jgi:hypothetical protein
MLVSKDCTIGLAAPECHCETIGGVKCRCRRDDFHPKEWKTGTMMEIFSNTEIILSFLAGLSPDRF